jgi:hypothetical protein
MKLKELCDQNKNKKQELLITLILITVIIKKTNS